MKLKLALTPQQLEEMLNNAKIGGLAEIIITLDEVKNISHKDIEINIR